MFGSHDNRLSPKLTRQLLIVVTILFGLAAVLMLTAFLILANSTRSTYWILIVSLFFLVATLASGRALFSHRGNKP